MKYLDVYVVISPARGGDFEVNVASDAGGEGNSILKLPFAMHDLAGVMFSGGVDRGIGRVNADGTAASLGTASTFGVQLFEALFQGETREVLSRTESEAKRMADTGVRIRLSMNLAAEGMAEVASLPWELMRRRDQSPLVVSVQTPVVRAFDTPKPIFLQPMKGKLRILALVSNPTGTAALNLQEETDRIGAIWSKLANVEVDFCRPVENDILNHLAENDYHVIHYMGHGDFDSGAGGLLMMERDDGSAHLVTGDTFAAWLQDEPLRLVFLNACNTGTTGGHNGLHPFAGVASALIRSGVPAVVAMQFPISDKSAITFAQTFYQRIAQSFPVDAAVGDGRKRLLSSEGAEWATPVLYMRAADGNLFDNAKATTTPRKRAAVKAGEDAPLDMSRAAPVADAIQPQPMVTEPAARLVPSTPDHAAEVAPPAANVARTSPQAANGEALLPARPWYKKPIGIGSIAATLILILILILASNDSTGELTAETAAAVTSTEAVAKPLNIVPDPNNPATPAIAEIDAGAWINDENPKKITASVLKKSSVANIQALADAGFDKAQYIMGDIYWFGLAGVATSQAKAVPYFAKAAGQGIAPAELSMGYIYSTGVADEVTSTGSTIKGTAIDHAKAKNFLRRAANQGNDVAQQLLIDKYG